MTKEEYKQLMNDYGFSVVEDDLAVNGLSYVAFYGNSSDSDWQNIFAVFETDKGVVKSYTKLYYEQSQGICVVYDKMIETKDIDELRQVVISIAEQYKNLLVIQKKEEIKKDFI